MLRTALLACALSSQFANADDVGKYRTVTAVGDSITFGSCSSAPGSYPCGTGDKAYAAVLQNDVLWDKNRTTYNINNYGASGTTATISGDYPYVETVEYQLALTSNPDAVVMMLGTNDAKPQNWGQGSYEEDLTDLANTFLNLPSKPDLFMMVPPPLYSDGAYDMNQTVINSFLPEIVPRVAESVGATVIDVFGEMGGTKDCISVDCLDGYELFCNHQSCDPCHPNDTGYVRMASIVFKVLYSDTMHNLGRPGEWPTLAEL